MTHKERILAACRGEVPDCIPWIPRLDLWYNAHRRAGTLPKGFEGATLRQITDGLGVGYHAVVPDFLNVDSLNDIVDQGLGIYRLKEMPFTTVLHGVEREVTREEHRTRVVYHTPVGSVSCTVRYTPEMRAAGASLPWAEEHALKGPADYQVLEHIFSHLEVIPDETRYRQWQEWVGEAGVAVAYGWLAASPIHHIMRELMTMTEFFLEMHDYPERLAALAESMEPWFEHTLAALAQSSAEVIFVGANYDETITYPPFFEEHLLPWLVRAGEIAHEQGKLLLTHTDGENEGLLELYRRCNFDIADSICPAPMTKLTLAEAIEGLPGITIWGGIPSVAVCDSSMREAEFARIVDEAIDLARGSSHLILSIADTTPATANFQRLLQITELVSS